VSSKYQNFGVFQELFLSSFRIEEMGFDSMESFLLSLNDAVLHMQYVNQKIIVYPHSHHTEPKLDNPLPHLTEVSVCYRMWKIFRLIMLFVSVVAKVLHNTKSSLYS